MSPAPGGPNYGLGIVDFDGFLGHDGGLPSFQSWMGYQPDKHATVIELTNRPTAPESTTLPANALATIIREHLQ